jgi:hypothetical protein
MTPETTIVQILLLFDKQSSVEYGSALWAAMHEVEAFYKLGGRPVNVHRLYMSTYVPASNIIGATWRYLFSPKDLADAVDLLRQDKHASLSPGLATAAVPDSPTYDQRKLIGIARDQILREEFGPAGATIPLMIVTDKLITPPEDWRYIIWDSWSETESTAPTGTYLTDSDSFSPPPHSAVISTVPLDPTYWNIVDDNRVATIKDRARTAAMSVCGTFLGLHRCRNRRCFLYRSVDSVQDLDFMDRIGPEHSEVEKLNGRGFQASVANPSVVQEVIFRPSGSRRSV